MNKKAEQFKAFLEANKVTAFKMEEVQTNVRNTVVFRSFITVEGQQLPTMLVTDDSPFSIIRVQVVPQAMKEKDALNLLKMVNEQNIRYKPFKLFFDEAGNLVLDTCMLIKEEQLDGNDVYRMFNAIISYLHKNYREIMKTVWQ